MEAFRTPVYKKHTASPLWIRYLKGFLLAKARANLCPSRDEAFSQRHFNTSDPNGVILVIPPDEILSRSI